MKRFGMMVAALMMTATVAFAQGEKKSEEISFKRLSNYLRLNVEQVEEVSHINDYFVQQLGGAISGQTLCNNEKPEEVEKALLCNLKLMKKALSNEQYKKYVALINVTRANMNGKINDPVLESYLAIK